MEKISVPKDEWHSLLDFFNHVIESVYEYDSNYKVRAEHVRKTINKESKNVILIRRKNQGKT